MNLKLKIFVLVIFMISCNKEFVEKPIDLISEDEMVNILYDIAIVKANSSVKTNGRDERLNGKGNNFDNYVFDKYKIDSTQLAKSNIYYASKSDLHIRIFTRVLERLETKKEILAKEKDSLKPKTKAEKTKLEKTKPEKKKPLDV